MIPTPKLKKETANILLATSTAEAGDDDDWVSDELVIPWTVADLFKDKDPKTYVNYHVCAMGYHLLTPAGVILGTVVSPFFSVPTLHMAANGGILLGLTGIGAGYYKFSQKVKEESEADPPIVVEKMKNRRESIMANYKIRTVDAGTYCGMGSGALVMLLRGGPAKMGLKGGPLGVLQALTLGSAIGSFTAFGYLTARGDGMAG